MGIGTWTIWIKDQFINNPKLKALTFYSRDGDFKELISPLKQLETLEFSTTGEKPRLSPDLFSDNENLKYVQIRANVTNLPEGLFSNNKNLHGLKMAVGSGVREFPENLLANASKLKKLNLSFVNLEQIPAKLLSKNRELEHLAFSFDSAEGVENLPDLTKGFGKLEYIIIDPKPMSENQKSDISKKLSTQHPKTTIQLSRSWREWRIRAEKDIVIRPRRNGATTRPTN